MGERETVRRPNGKQDRLQRAYERGLADAAKGRRELENPFFVGTHRLAWQRGWREETLRRNPSPRP